MASTTTGTMATRVPNEKKEVIEEAIAKSGCSLRIVFENIADMISDGRMTLNADGITLIGSLGETVTVTKRETNSSRIAERDAKLIEVNRELREEIVTLKEYIAELDGEPKEWSDEVKEIGSMARSVGLTTEELLIQFKDKLASGEIGLTRNGLSVWTVDDCPFDWRFFTSACDEMGHDYNDAIRKLTPLLFRV